MNSNSNNLIDDQFNYNDNQRLDKGKYHKWKKHQSMSEFGKSHLKCKDKRKFKNSTNKAKYYKNIDFDSKYLKVIDKPSTPHNTSQFIVNKFNSSQKQDDISNNYPNDNAFDIDIGNFFFGADAINLQEQFLHEEKGEEEQPQQQQGHSTLSFHRRRYLSTDINQINNTIKEEDNQQGIAETANQIDMQIDNMLNLRKNTSSFFNTEDLNIEEEDINIT